MTAEKKWVWDDRYDYLRDTRDLYYNEDYLEFLVRIVWKLDRPVDMIDFGCGYGYLGLKLLPLLPEGSTYTGIDRSGELLKRARDAFQGTFYSAEFVEADLEGEVELDRRYDLAVCHALLLHLPDPVRTLGRMAGCVREGGRLICFEPHWIGGMAGHQSGEGDASEVVPLGVLQKLYEDGRQRTGRDGNIGLKLPAYFSRLGLRNVECRVSDKVNFLDPRSGERERQELFHALKQEGLGTMPGERGAFVQGLLDRGLSLREVEVQYEAERLYAERFQVDSPLAYAPGMKITFGTVGPQRIEGSSFLNF
ncbi:class I SAM-dependent methyltransferase [Paenibacillus caseinilyticus]|uniref:Methyltransferase n=1 Tax=Paenibacillus mucilaginosus K02 TaxID=997761 RepID=I0BQJ8_9BACL|nr:methyltransferase domain-containing protein [Paenibacillus mucilaginosus]AFH64645.1 methyltransferase [Paenibacillus mucilaginosus K02]